MYNYIPVCCRLYLELRLVDEAGVEEQQLAIVSCESLHELT